MHVYHFYFIIIVTKNNVFLYENKLRLIEKKYLKKDSFKE